MYFVAKISDLYASSLTGALRANIGPIKKQHKTPTPKQHKSVMKKYNIGIKERVLFAL